MRSRFSSPTVFLMSLNPEAPRTSVIWTFQTRIRLAIRFAMRGTSRDAFEAFLLQVFLPGHGIDGQKNRPVDLYAVGSALNGLLGVGRRPEPSRGEDGEAVPDLLIDEETVNRRNGICRRVVPFLRVIFGGEDEDIKRGIEEGFKLLPEGRNRPQFRIHIFFPDGDDGRENGRIGEKGSETAFFGQAPRRSAQSRSRSRERSFRAFRGLLQILRTETENQAPVPVPHDRAKLFNVIEPHRAGGFPSPQPRSASIRAGPRSWPWARRSIRIGVLNPISRGGGV